MTSQEIWQADSRIETFSVTKSGGYYILYINIKSDNDDDARCPKLIICLPRNSRVTAVTLPKGHENMAFQVLGNKTQAAKNAENKDQIDGCVRFDLPNLGTKTNMIFKITFVATSDGLRSDSEASAFIYSLTPEKDKKNNFKTIQIN
ncbi:MAG: hypothetical protein P1U56_09585 [Saprospiraceae bacterium]|nr:hypothetical protein [Saprospiraceae bacterium]